jgi:hypothetical protein
MTADQATDTTRLKEAATQARVALERARAGRASQSLVMVGAPPPAAATLLDQIDREARALGLLTLRADAGAGVSLPALLARQLRDALQPLALNPGTQGLAAKADSALVGFARALRVRYPDIPLLEGTAEPGLADNGALEFDLLALMESVGRAAKAGATLLALLIDRLDRLDAPQLGALIAALHRCSQAGLPVLLIGTGAPSLRAQMAAAKSYSERLFAFLDLGAEQRAR